MAQPLFARAFAIASLLGGVSTPATAHPEVDARNRVSFQVEVTREIANDWVTARLSVAAEGKDPAVVADSVNQQMAAALGIAKKAKNVEVSSGAYTTQPVYDNGRVVRWRAHQELIAESGDVDRISKLIGTLQSDAVQLSSIHFSVKRETRKALEDELITEALAAFRARAALVARGMGAKDWSLVGLSIGHSGGSPRRIQMRAEADMMSMSKAAAPAFEAGTSEVQVQVSGDVELD
jgi:predicted secreted protein